MTLTASGYFVVLVNSGSYLDLIVVQLWYYLKLNRLSSEKMSSWLQTIREKPARCKKHARREKFARKKDVHEIMWKLTTHFSQFNYFLVKRNFIPCLMRKSFCLVHNYRFYCQMVRDVRHEKYVS